MEYDIVYDIENIKVKLSITDEESDNLLDALYHDAYSYMKIYLDKKEDEEVPQELLFIVEAVVIKRYRRIGAEGIAIEKIDVLTTTYEVGDDFAEYHSIMNRYKRNKSKKGFGFF